MTLNEVIDHAAEEHPETPLLKYWDSDEESPWINPNVYGALAYLIVTELAETYDSDASDEEQIAESKRVLDRASEEIGLLTETLAEFN